ncbi:Glucose/ribitol dehydrogenase [Penicillium macrosclerotiorum]|uniref:Glucose/ribitol dehydrogenase n=1 Tax=Penicillium macrosclerotiorum TaxID=303699 RepID=UPI0025491A2A|nr:Glucose/ribitol dehydrogenase [Penicillium macrosclerotiorum]KAJ5683442.1 Glucose/ribitol dehydrogenase [Penicillium macrosclerotiorum]
MSYKKSGGSPKVWLITGCSSGFGKVFIPSITARGDRVVATARDIRSLDEFASHENIRLLELDVTQPRKALKEAVKQAISFFGHIDVLVNNAGYVLSGVWEELSEIEITRQFHTNVLGPLDLTTALLPHMRSRGTGTIIFMSSIAAWRGVAVGGAYSASKFALEGAAESLQKEVEPFGLQVHVAVLGQFRTSILNSNRRLVSRSTRPLGEYDSAIQACLSRLEKTDGKQVGDPLKAVERIVDLVYHTGYFAELQRIPLRIFLGSDAMNIVRGECQSILDDIIRQEKVGRSTDFDDAKPSLPYN